MEGCTCAQFNDSTSKVVRCAHFEGYNVTLLELDETEDDDPGWYVVGPDRDEWSRILPALDQDARTKPMIWDVWEKEAAEADFTSRCEQMKSLPVS